MLTGEAQEIQSDKRRRVPVSRGLELYIIFIKQYK